MRRSLFQLFLGALSASSMFIASAASAAATDPACGNLDLVAQGNCKLEVEGGCTAKCEPIAFEAECDGECHATASVDCTASCNVGCEAECDLDPPSFECSAGCSVDCNAECEAGCDASADKVHCKAKCSGKCSASCDASCEGKPGTLDCKAKCEASCSGSCEVKADVGCDVTCEAKLQGGCEAACETPRGALYCDGQFIAVPDMEACLAALLKLEVTVDGYARCEGNTCEAAGEVEASICSVSNVKGAPWDVGAITAMAVGAGMVIARRGRRRS